jgi:hypothetical protein
MTWLRRRYGEGPLHLILSVACLAFAGYLVWTVLPAPNSVRLLVWIAAAAAVHDLVLWPLYAVTDRVLGPIGRKRRGTDGIHRASVPLINYIRVPAVLSAVMLLISFPLVLRHSEPAYHTASGLTEQPYLGRWLLLTGCAFGGSALLYIARLLRLKLRRGAE